MNHFVFTIFNQTKTAKNCFFKELFDKISLKIHCFAKKMFLMKKYFLKSIILPKSDASRIFSKMNNFLKFAFVLCLFCFSCDSKLPDLQGFDTQTWKKDVMGCESKRINLITDFEQKVKPKLKGLSEKQITDLLGKPDFLEMGKRSQKFCYYFLEKGQNCESDQKKIEKRGKFVQIRLDAFSNQVNEVSILSI
ncbi:MAG: hypothetical protein EAZ97_07615 [Bacteroidetes bacterium]|nr:MAG: hypothetical protein EAZ97_07615 [Bacteroidota bacterium]